MTYHTLTLFALLVGFAIGLWQWRNDQTPAGDAALRIWLSAAVVFLLRLVILVISLTAPSISDRPIPLLPILERTIDLASTVLLLYAILPSPRRYPRLLDSMLILGGFAVLGGYLLGARVWLDVLTEASGQFVDFNTLQQATVWSLAQIGLVLFGVIWLAVQRPYDWPIRTLVLLPIAAGYGAHLAQIRPAFDLPLVFELNLIPYWARFAYLLSFLFFAAFIYRHTLISLLYQLETRGQASSDVGGMLAKAAELTTKVELSDSMRAVIPFLQKLFIADLIGVAHVWHEDAGLLQFVVQWQDDEPQEWFLRIADWRSLRTALESGDTQTLNPIGQGAREHNDLRRELDVPGFGMMAVVPISDVYGPVGALVLGKPDEAADWSLSEITLAQQASGVVSTALRRSMTSLAADDGASSSVGDLNGLPHLETESDEISEEIEPTNPLMSATPVYRAEPEPAAPAADGELGSLKTQVDLLTRSLRSAEEALARASASDGAVDPDWVNRALNNYSSELEQAQSYISDLEGQLQRLVDGVLDRSLHQIAERFRSPLTAVEGYLSLVQSDLEGQNLLDDDSIALFGLVKKNLGRMLELVTQLESESYEMSSAVTDQATGSGGLRSETETHLLEGIERASETLKEKFRKIRLALEFDIPTDLPFLAISPADTHHLLEQTFKLMLSSLPSETKLIIHAKPVVLGGHSDEANFVELRFVGQGKTLVSRIQRALYTESGKGSSDMLVAVWYTLVQQNQARMWIELSSDVDQSTIVLVLPAA